MDACSDNFLSKNGNAVYPKVPAIEFTRPSQFRQRKLWYNHSIVGRGKDLYSWPTIDIKMRTDPMPPQKRQDQARIIAARERTANRVSKTGGYGIEILVQHPDTAFAAFFKRKIREHRRENHRTASGIQSLALYR